MSTNSTVFIGTWVNWSRGRIYGSTLTLPAQNAAILIAALALFIRFTGTKLWSILCFVTHQLGTTRRPQDGMYHQLQATLRNNGSDAGTVWQVAKIAWIWRAPRSKSFRKSLSLMLLGIIHLMVFSAAGLLSFRLTTVQDEVLVRSLNCGPWFMNTSAPALLTLTELTDYKIHRNANFQLTKQYVQDCTNGSHSSTECSTFKSLGLNYVTTKHAPCPFSDEMCLGPPNTAASFDTGFIDSCLDLGINAEIEDRVQLRKTMTCSPITTNGFFQNGTFTLDGQEYSYASLSYGRRNFSSVPDTIILPDSVPLENATFLLVNSSILLLPYIEEAANPSPYTFQLMVDAQMAAFYEGFPGFAPVSNLSVVNQTLNLIFVTFSGFYTNASDDLWLPAHQMTNFTAKVNGAGLIRTAYAPDNAISVLACTEQHQFCNPNRGPSDVRCTPMLPLWELVNGWNDTSTGYYGPVFDTDNQFATVGVMTYAVQEAQLAFTTDSFYTVPLLAEDLREGRVALGLPDNQWIQEADHLFAMGMNSIQRWVTESATGPPEPWDQYTAGYYPPGEWICDNQIIRDARYTSFSILWISLIFGMGGLVILASLNLETVVSYFQRRYKRGLYQQVRWQLDSTLQLQRMAFEEGGFGVWEGGANEVLTTVVKTEQIQTAMEWDELHPSICGKTSKWRKGSTMRELTDESKESISERNSLL
ncbi:hypothetical protein N431DRAFT_370723 [Stipitochalara longipes BDJ]|nr:hypothetical protein N431DRAFT_370723 [Stipitochalara longipes BDJ]